MVDMSGMPGLLSEVGCHSQHVCAGNWIRDFPIATDATGLQFTGGQGADCRGALSEVADLSGASGLRG